MQLEVKWFVSMLITNKLITADEANLLNQILGGDPDLATYSEKYLAQKISGLKQEDEQLWRKHIQSAVDLAREMAASGATPENAAEFSDVVIENASSKEINVTATHSERCTPKVEYPQFSSLTNDSNDQSFTLKHSSVYSDDANRNNNDLYDPEEDRSVLENLKILRRINSFFSLLLITGLILVACICFFEKENRTGILCLFILLLVGFEYFVVDILINWFRGIYRNLMFIVRYR